MLVPLSILAVKEPRARKLINNRLLVILDAVKTEIQQIQELVTVFGS